ncbi:TPM domain-containing protein [Sphingomonas sp. HITSZ_GF]|uniref:TPM domain-containing protein n=1 Tax=Sphingomonas sp. HITSZ_GF TaxID=3037247 RepID=UPI00240CF2BE|nr:TPM domain-containing protein [Sphingomonas sp. HITSZ_GF]MDG2533370.1 TPM domain-containing protein [Sphingomonas sp. HITSZ_GF]
MTLLRSLLALLLVLVPLSAQAQPNFPKLTGRVVDEAHLLSVPQVAELTQLSEQVEQASTRQFVVVTIPDLQGYDIADYGYQLGRSWGIGQKDAKNGILLIVAPNERKVRIEVGYGLEPIMTDGMSSQIINETIIPKFKAGDMPGGIMAGAKAIAEQMKLPLEAAEQRAQEQQAKVTQKRQKSHSSGGFPIGLIFWGIIFLFVILPMLGLGRRKRRGPWDRRYRGDDSGALPIILWSIANEIGREAGRGGGSSWGGGGGGGWGGGGGGGGFSGGGGSFGGGGASGSW